MRDFDHPYRYWGHPPYSHYSPFQSPPGGSPEDIASTPGGRTQGGKWIDISNPGFAKGALVGAAAAWLLSNEEAQRRIFKSVAGLLMVARSSLEEVKERFQDAEAEIRAERDY